MYAELILPVPLPRTFTYRLPDGMAERARVGMRVSVPFGKNHTYTGIIVQLLSEAPEGYDIKEVTALPDEQPVVRQIQLDLWQWIADYYLCAIGDVMKAALPSELKPESGKKGIVREDFKPRMRNLVRVNSALKLSEAFALLKRSPKQQALFMRLLELSHAMQTHNPELVPQEVLLQSPDASPVQLRELVKKGFCTIVQQEVSRLDTGQTAAAVSPEPAYPLTEMQQVAYRDICRQFHDHSVVLLHGVTSSGKTEIYMHLMQLVIGQGHQVLMMVPEIALTTQLCQRLRRVFGGRMLVYHSKLSETERVEIWKRLLSDDSGVDVFLGVRSAVFLPFRQLGLVIVDEEHEPSYKQQDPAPRYQGRDLAIVLATRHGAKTVLGSATPSLESWYLAKQGKYGLVQLTERHAGVSMPSIRLVSLTAAKKNGGMQGPFSPELLSTLRKTLDGGRQAILFQNRRGFAPIIECTNCGWTPHCPRCDVPLSYHKRTRQLVCHYCGYRMPWPSQCPLCGNPKLDILGFGTERIEETLTQLLPQSKSVRMDTDTTGSRQSYERILTDFGAHKTNVLIGTQMVSKGLDFNGVQTVGVLNADSLMNYPDFRAHERAFQLMEQVAGRAGRRAGQEGQVLIQCSDPQSRLLRQVVHHDYEGMAETQLQDRQSHGFPPYTRLIMIFIKGRYEDRTRHLAEQYAAALRQVYGQRVLGPDAPAVSRLKGFYVQQIILKVEREASTAQVRQGLKAIHQKFVESDPEMQRVVFYYNVDPM